MLSTVKIEVKGGFPGNQKQGLNIPLYIQYKYAHGHIEHIMYMYAAFTWTTHMHMHAHPLPPCPDCMVGNSSWITMLEFCLWMRRSVGCISGRGPTTNKSNSLTAYLDWMGRTCSIILGLDRESKELCFSSNSSIHIESLWRTLSLECRHYRKKYSQIHIHN